MNVKDTFGLSHDDRLDDPNSGFIAGVECEIESVAGVQSFINFECTEDGSLRNNGYEFISYPLNRGDLVNSFKNLHAKIKLRKKEEAFSPRTSTHVHVNCRHLEFEQVKTIVLLYALFEECFFSMVEPNRRNNIHCVALSDTLLSSSYGEALGWMFKKWHKYTALNLLPLGKIGTIEFRHLQGTNNADLLNEWLTTLENLWNLGKVLTISAESVSNPAVLDVWYQTIFGHSPRMMALRPAVPAMIKNSVIDVKHAF